MTERENYCERVEVLARFYRCKIRALDSLTNLDPSTLHQVAIRRSGIHYKKPYCPHDKAWARLEDEERRAGILMTPEQKYAEAISRIKALEAEVAKLRASSLSGFEKFRNLMFGEDANREKR